MITYNWNCKTVDVYLQSEGETNVVYNVHWIVTGVSEELDANEKPYLATSIGTQIVLIDPDTDFIDFEDLTNEIVVEWTKNAIGEEQLQKIEEHISYQINELVNPTSITMTIEN
jgi:hypothetical protein